ncbi:MAG: hypothetical protein ACK5LV_08885 [Lachnospirales bacterium]
MTKEIKRLLVFVLGILGTALGNALIFNANLGNTAWGVVAVNINRYNSNISEGFALGILSCVVFILCRFVEKEFNLIKDIVGLMMSLIFGSLISLFSNLTQFLVFDTFLLQFFVLILGIVILAFSIVVYLKADIFKLPFDDSVVVFAKNLFKNNIAYGSYFCVFLAFIITMVFVTLTGNLYGFNFITVIICIIFGPILDIFFKKSKWIDVIIGNS